MSPPGDEDVSERRASEPRDEAEPERRTAVDGDDADDATTRSWMTEFRTAESGGLMIVREMATSAGAVLLVGLLLFGVSGVWPPMVAVESGSMEPHMERGDLVFIVEEHRFAGAGAYADTGVVPYQTATETGYRSIGDHGDVIIYQADGGSGTPIIHRARFWVNESENWYEKADQRYIAADSCAELQNCPAPHAGFITKGDNERTNDYYDQVSGISEPVKPEWITGSAKLKVPYLGQIRLLFAELAAASTGNGPVSTVGPASAEGPVSTVRSPSTMSAGVPATMSAGTPAATTAAAGRA